MQIASIIFTVGLLTLIGLYLYAPFLERSARRVTETEHEISALLAERERAITALQELDFDYKLGKVPEEDYLNQRASLLQKGAEILKRLDELTPKNQPDDTDTRIERAIAARRRNTSGQVMTDDEIESLVSARRRGHREKTGGFCPKCGKAVMMSDRFCPSCGKPLT